MNPTVVLAALVAATAPADLQALAGALTAAQADVFARLVTTCSALPPTRVSPVAKSAKPSARIKMKVPDVAERMGVTPDWVRRNWKKKGMPGNKPGHRTLWFDSREFESWYEEYRRSGAA